MLWVVLIYTMNSNHILYVRPPASTNIDRPYNFFTFDIIVLSILQHVNKIASINKTNPIKLFSVPILYFPFLKVHI